MKSVRQTSIELLQISDLFLNMVEHYSSSAFIPPQLLVSVSFYKRTWNLLIRSIDAQHFSLCTICIVTD